MTDLETRVRDALRGAVAERPADVLLGDVRRGARRRRTRRAASAACVAVLVVAGVLGVTASRHDPQQPLPSHRVPLGRTAVDGLAVTATGEHFKVTLGHGCASPCTAVWSQQDDAGWTRISTISDQLLGFTMAPDGTNGWAPGRSAVWSTHDSGHTWSRVSAFASPRARDVGIMTGPRVAWALLPGNGNARLWRTAVGSDSWKRVEVPASLKTPSMENVLPDSRVVLGDLTIPVVTVQHVVVGDGTTWRRHSIPCYPVPSLLGTEPSTRGTRCGLVRIPLNMSPNQLELPYGKGGPLGSELDIGMLTTPGSPVGQVRSLYVSGSHAVVYSPDGQQPAHLDLEAHEIIQWAAFAGDQGVLSTTRNRLFASRDGGYTWTPLP